MFDNAEDASIIDVLACPKSKYMTALVVLPKSVPVIALVKVKLTLYSPSDNTDQSTKMCFLLLVCFLQNYYLKQNYRFFF